MYLCACLPCLIAECKVLYSCCQAQPQSLANGKAALAAGLPRRKASTTAVKRCPDIVTSSRQATLRPLRLDREQLSGLRCTHFDVLTGCLALLEVICMAPFKVWNHLERWIINPTEI